MRRVFIVTVLLLVVCTAACAAKNVSSATVQRQRDHQRSIRWAERALNDIPATPVGDCDIGYFPYALQDAAVAFQAVLDKYGPDARMEVGLAKCLMRLGQYHAAMQLSRQAMTLTHGSRNAVSVYRSSREYWRMARQIASHLSRNRHLIQICPVSIPHRKPLWLATSDEIVADNGNLTAINLELYQTTRHGLRQTWHSSLHDPRFTPEEFRHTQLFAMDITGDGVPEAIVSEALPGGDCDPTHMDVFALHGEKMVPLFAGVSDYDIWLSDFNHDHRYQLVCSYKVGQFMCCAAMPKWIDIYAFRGRHYRLENDAFPQAYREVTQRVREAFDQYPDDPAIREYLGCLSEITGYRKAALARYRSAAHERLTMLTQATDPDSRAEFRQDVHRLQLRIAALHRRRSV